MEQALTAVSVCAHCGDPCGPEICDQSGAVFCCAGCRTVYELLHDKDLGEYYRLGARPGLKPGAFSPDSSYTYLDDESVLDRLLDFRSASAARIHLRIPQMHCSSCVWLLENLHAFTDGLAETRVDFPRRTLSVVFDPSRTSLRQLVELLASLGYAPEITLKQLDGKRPDRSMRALYGRVALAGFCFGNVMLLSFPHYLGLEATSDPRYVRYFSYLTILLSLPVVLYSSAEFFRSAIRGWRYRTVTMDVPIALGITILFIRSTYDILALGQAGYMDSLCGLVFFLLLGRLYQRKTYAALSFDNDYQTYFPIAVHVRDGGREVTRSLDQLRAGDRLYIRNGELIPADSVLIRGEALIDYSFVTGESEPVRVRAGERVYAGGRQAGQRLELDVVKEPSQSYLIQLWNAQASPPLADDLTSLANRVSRWFTPGIIGLATATGVAWAFVDIGTAFDAATAVLVIACPCALALATPFTLGTLHRWLGRNGLFLKDPGVIERLADVDHILFDKTGTITVAGSREPEYVGEPLAETERTAIALLASHSTHPLASPLSRLSGDGSKSELSGFREVSGRGIEGVVDGRTIRLGSAAWTGHADEGGRGDLLPSEMRVYVAIDGRPLGWFRYTSTIREGLREIISSLGERYRLGMLSGDTESERARLAPIFGEGVELRFRQSPHDKRDYIEKLTARGAKTLMVGDGLNDAGALSVAQVGIAVTEDDAAFSPASDGIVRANALPRLPSALRLARRSVGVIKVCFGVSLLYNAIGLYFAVQGLLSPVLAAILMPVSSVTVVALSTVAISRMARREGLA
ncbi:MAG: heavy metal translocating P-type ATPase [candidate division Zixibacteria bacterium]|nr:heavy metal translocating P-type ATPase [candidate division Zixibacteria bacterium]